MFSNFIVCVQYFRYKNAVARNCYIDAVGLWWCSAPLHHHHATFPCFSITINLQCFCSYKVIKLLSRVHQPRSWFPSLYSVKYFQSYCFTPKTLTSFIAFVVSWMVGLHKQSKQIFKCFRTELLLESFNNIEWPKFKQGVFNCESHRWHYRY